ncbi:MAG: hypothetical protein QOE92_1944 [Chloroflexota bacterium]|jgi:hypothetical protein|nr:hypothetical protein [Chloroflexota bacterium]
MLEFGLILPVFLLLTLAVLEVGLMFFTIGAGRYIGGEAARQLAQAANRSTADQEMLKVIDGSALRTTTRAEVVSVSVEQMTSAGARTGKLQVYTPNGAAWVPTGNWPPSDRIVRTGCLDKAMVTINYLYRPKTGLFGKQLTIQLKIQYLISMEPQLVDATPCPPGL